MLSAAVNELSTHTGYGKKCGELLRQYWQPSVVVIKLTKERSVRAVTMLGENLVLSPC